MNFTSKIKGQIVEGMDDFFDTIHIIIIFVYAFMPAKSEALEFSDIIQEDNCFEVVGKIRNRDESVFHSEYYKYQSNKIEQS